MVELQKKLDTDYPNCKFSHGSRDFWTGWEYTEPNDKDDDDQKCMADDEADIHVHSCSKGMKVGFSEVRIPKGENSRGNTIYKTIPIVFISTRVGKEQNILRTNIRLIERFHPTIRKLKKFLENSRAIKVKREAIKIEHHLAKMIPDRIDNILLGGKNDDKAKNS